MSLHRYSITGAGGVYSSVVSLTTRQFSHDLLSKKYTLSTRWVWSTRLCFVYAPFIELTIFHEGVERWPVKRVCPCSLIRFAVACVYIRVVLFYLFHTAWLFVCGGVLHICAVGIGVWTLILYICTCMWKWDHSAVVLSVNTGCSRPLLIPSRVTKWSLTVQSDTSLL